MIIDSILIYLKPEIARMGIDRRGRQNLLELALVFAGFYLPGLLWPATAPGGGELALYMARFLAAAAPQVLLLGYLIWLRGPSSPGISVWAEFGLPRPRVSDLGWALALLAGACLLLAAAGLLLSLLPEEVRRGLAGGFRWRLPDTRLLPLAAVFSLLTGYREELFFRAYLITRLQQVGLSPAAGVAASALLFACGHAYQGPVGLAVALALGVYFAVAFVRLRNLHRVAWAHGLYNLAVLAATLLGDQLPLPGAAVQVIFRAG
jgi:membrane protease YdiL (CAAX protease family)